MIHQLDQIGVAVISLLKDSAKLVALESKVLSISIRPFVVCMMLAVFAGFSAWFGLLVILSIGLYTYTQHLLLSAVMTFCINIAMLILFYGLCVMYKKRMSFTHSKQALQSLWNDIP